ncbi:hypothetical protein B296_00008901, partial [Ensete ventricosum]
KETKGTQKLNMSYENTRAPLSSHSSGVRIRTRSDLDDIAGFAVPSRPVLLGGGQDGVRLENYAKTEEPKVEELTKALANSGAKVFVSGAAVGNLALHVCKHCSGKSYCQPPKVTLHPVERKDLYSTSLAVTRTCIYLHAGHDRAVFYSIRPSGAIEVNFHTKTKTFSVLLAVLDMKSTSCIMRIALGAAKGLAFLHEAEKPVIYRDFKTFGIVLLELLTGRKSLDKSRPVREQMLADWAAPLLTQKRKVMGVIDPRLGGDYPDKAVQKIAMLAHHCLNRNPKARPLMRDIVCSLEPLQVAVDVPVMEAINP